MLAIALDRDVEVSDDVREVRIQFHVAMFLFSKCQFLVDNWVLARVNLSLSNFQKRKHRGRLTKTKGIVMLYGRIANLNRPYSAHAW